MSAQLETDDVNAVHLVGRVGAEPVETELPSGDTITSFRVIVGRPEGHGSTQRVDTLDCTAWTGRARRSARTWRKDDLVEVEGAVRRRFFATSTGRASRVDIEVSAARLIRRAPSA
jgi:single-strand DNA-binding protein